MTRISECTVLFADLRGSTGLYESLGNSQATAVVSHSVALLCQWVNKCGGQVVKTLGDGLMAIFTVPAHALQAADAMHQALDSMPEQILRSVGKDPIPVWLKSMGTLQLQVALAGGEVIEMSGDFFGDAVNVAARLLDHAGDNETLVTQWVIDALPTAEHERFRRLNHVQLRGRLEPVSIFLLDARRHANEWVSTMLGDTPTLMDPECIRLCWNNHPQVHSAHNLPIVFGRSPQANYFVDDSLVSRLHARLDWHSGSFQLTDLSFNGTYLRFNGHEPLVSLRRSGCTLHGSGTFGLGRSPADPLVPQIQFEILQSPPIPSAA